MKIYFAQSGKNGPIKIGVSDHPTKRIAELNTGSSDPIKILGMRKGSHQDEVFFHKLFKDYHLNGEWFEPVPELLAYIDAFLIRAPREEGPPQDEKLWTAKDLAAFLNVKPGTIFSWMSRKVDLPPSIKIEGTTRWRESVVRKWIEERENKKKRTNFED
jgi:predicted DNA-binding transcriptional regulator AlpA